MREETGPKCVFESLQQIIQRQCDALISLGFDPSLKVYTRAFVFVLYSIATGDLCLCRSLSAGGS